MVLKELSTVIWNAVNAIAQVTLRNDASKLVELEQILSASNNEKLRRIALAALLKKHHPHHH
jgi:hypothetical protein